MRDSGEEKQKHKSVNAGFSKSVVNCDGKKFEKFALLCSIMAILLHKLRI